MGPARNAGQLRIARRIEVGDVNHTYPHCAIFAAYGRGVITWRKCAYDCAFQVVRRCLTGGLDFRLLRVPPVVVRDDQAAVSIMQLKHWIAKLPRDASQRWTKGAQQHFFGRISCDRKAADKQVITRLDQSARREADAVCASGRGRECGRDAAKEKLEESAWQRRRGCLFCFHVRSTVPSPSGTRNHPQPGGQHRAFLRLIQSSSRNWGSR